MLTIQPRRAKSCTRSSSTPRKQLTAKDIVAELKPLHQLAVETANGIGKVAVEQVGKCSTIPFAPERIQKFEARSAIGKKRKSPKC